MMEHIYLVQQVGSDYYKVGRGDDPCKRRTNLQSGNPLRIEIVAAWCAVVADLDHHHKAPQRGNSTQVENAVRAALGGEPVGGGGEWVRVSAVPLKNLDAAASGYGMVRACVYLSRWDDRRVLPDDVRGSLEAGYRGRLEAIAAEWSTVK